MSFESSFYNLKGNRMSATQRDTTIMNLHGIAELVAIELQERQLSSLSETQRQIVRMLQENGFLSPTNEVAGQVGKAASYG